MPFYAVRKGRKPGVYETWAECQEQTVKFTGAKFKKFSTEQEALDFVQDSAAGAVSPGTKRPVSSDTDKDVDAPTPPKKANVKNDKSADEVVDYWTGEKFNEDDGVKVYTEGTCGFHGKNGARGGIGIFFATDDSRNLSERLTGNKPTSNTAKIHAARRAAEQAKADGIKNLILHTDSQFLINSITSWINGWKKNDWVKKNGDAVSNKDDFVQLDSAIEDINIKWVYVKGHDGNPGNEAANKLAKEGSKKSLPTD